AQELPSKLTGLEKLPTLLESAEQLQQSFPDGLDRGLEKARGRTLEQSASGAETRGAAPPPRQGPVGPQPEAPARTAPARPSRASGGVQGMPAMQGLKAPEGAPTRAFRAGGLPPGAPTPDAARVSGREGPRGSTPIAG